VAVPRQEKLRRPGHGERLAPIWMLAWALLYGPVAALLRLRYRNIGRLPQKGGAIVVVNHVSHLDPVLLAKFVIDAARVPRFLAKESIFAVPVVGRAMRAMGHIPVRRGSADAGQSLAAAADALRAGRLIVMHPEGTVTRDPEGWPMSGKTGAARLALMMPDVPVIPLAQWGVQESVDLYRKRIRLIPRPRHTMSVGEPIDLSRFRGREPSPGVLREMTDVIMRTLRADVAALRGLPAPKGELFRWMRSSEAA
jgi:1-acyl-sn-glycerol-3-phosphate acyltransferase